MPICDSRIIGGSLRPDSRSSASTSRDAWHVARWSIKCCRHRSSRRSPSDNGADEIAGSRCDQHLIGKSDASCVDPSEHCPLGFSTVWRSCRSANRVGVRPLLEHDALLNGIFRVEVRACRGRPQFQELHRSASDVLLGHHTGRNRFGTGIVNRDRCPLRSSPASTTSKYHRSLPIQGLQTRRNCRNPASWVHKGLANPLRVLLVRLLDVGPFGLALHSSKSSRPFIRGIRAAPVGNGREISKRVGPTCSSQKALGDPRSRSLRKPARRIQPRGTVLHEPRRS